MNAETVWIRIGDYTISELAFAALPLKVKAGASWFSPAERAIMVEALERLAASRPAPAPQPAIDGMRAAIQQWAIYCFNHHGDDANLYNGLAELGGVDLDGKGWIPPAAAPAPLDDSRCAVCGWPLDPAEQMCRRGNCSMRPLPERAADPARAVAEYEAVWGDHNVRGTLRPWRAQLAAPAPVEPPPASQEALPCKNCRGFDTLCNRCGGSGYVVVARRKAQE